MVPHTEPVPRTVEAVAEGPYFDELSVGQIFDTAPALTLTAGHAATHQAIVGDRLRLPLDAVLCQEVVGAAPLAHPALVWDVAIGQSTLATHHVKANLFYRGLAFHRAPLVGDTLLTSTQVVALRQNRVRPGRRPTGLAALRITTVDQHERPVLDFWRCAMLPLREGREAQTGHQADLDGVGSSPSDVALAEVVTGWRLDRFRQRTSGMGFDDLAEGRTWRIGGGDVVSGAPELARLTLNIAKVHHDAQAAGGRRLVYGGHTIGLALAQTGRALPGIITVAGWHGCDHVGPVYEGDTLHSGITVERRQALGADGGGLVHLRSRVWAVGAGAEEPREVLDWRYVVVMA